MKPKIVVGYVENCILKVKTFSTKEAATKFVAKYKSKGLDDNWAYFQVSGVTGKFKWLDR
jgi:hypothetical protein